VTNSITSGLHRQQIQSQKPIIRSEIKSEPLGLNKMATITSSVIPVSASYYSSSLGTIIFKITDPVLVLGA